MATTQGLKYEIPSEMREFAEKSVDQARKAFDGFLGAAHKAVDTLQGSSSSMHTTATDATRKTLGFAEQNIAAAFDHAQKLFRAKDLQEAMQIQTEYARSQFATLQSQMKELGETAQEAARTATNQAASAASQAAEHARSAADRATSMMGQNANQAAGAMNRTGES